MTGAAGRSPTPPSATGREPTRADSWHQDHPALSSEKISTLSSFTWSIAEILRGDFKQSEYGKVILPFVVLRRLDCILEPTKDAVLAANAALPEGIDDDTRDHFLFHAAGAQLRIYNTSQITFTRIKTQQATQLHDNLIAYVTSFSANVRDIF